MGNKTRVLTYHDFSIIIIVHLHHAPAFLPLLLMRHLSLMLSNSEEDHCELKIFLALHCMMIMRINGVYCRQLFP